MVVSKTSSDFSAQGTIEYLIIIAVIVVISLIVVGLFVTVFNSPSQEIVDSSSKAGAVAVSGISIVESIIDYDGDSLIRLSNNSSDAITLTKVSVGGVDNNFSEQLVGLDSKVFSLNSLNSNCPCSVGQKSVKCEVKIIYTTATGITQTDYRTINAQCVNDSTPVNPAVVVDPIVSVLELGTIENPWIINNCQELQDMNLHLDGNYILGNTIDCLLITNFIPVGNESTPFIGSLNGNNYFINNLIINKPTTDNVGLFGYAAGTTISNLGLTNSIVTGRYTVGGIIGSMNDGTITNVFNAGKVIAKQTTSGGIVGFLAGDGSITNSYNAGDVNAAGSDIYSFAGGIVGYFDSGTISFSYNTGKIKASKNYAGGIAGYINSVGIITNTYNIGDVNANNEVGGITGRIQSDGGIVEYSYNTGNIRATNENAGGIVGSANSTFDVIKNSYNTGMVNASLTAGGIIGMQWGGIISNSYNTGDVNTTWNAGGIAGNLTFGTITNTYNTGDINAKYYSSGIAVVMLESLIENSFNTGRVTSISDTGRGIVRDLRSGTITNTYWDTFLTNQSTCLTDNNLGCVPTNNTPSWYYSSINAPLSSWTFGTDANWVTTATYPILSWQ